MFIECEIVIGTMLELMRSYGAPSFPVHDSIIVRKSDTELALDILSQQFSSKTGIRPKLKVKWCQNERDNNRDLSAVGSFWDFSVDQYVIIIYKLSTTL